MEPLMWWLWLLARLIIFLVTVRLSVWLLLWVVEKVYGISVSVRGYKILAADELIVKNKDYELLIEKPRLQLRWLNRSCRRLFRIRLYNVQLQCTRIPQQPPSSSNHGNKVVGGADNTKPSKKRRVLNHFMRQASRLVEVSIDQVDVMMQDVMSDTLGFLDMLRVTGGVSVLARPLPDSMMAVSFEVDRLSYQSCVCVSSNPQLPTSDDVLSLLESAVSCRALLFLAPLSPQRPLDSIQLNFSSFSLQLQSEPLTYFVQRINQLLINRKLSQAQSPSSSSLSTSKVTTHRLPPQRSEITLDKAYVEYCTKDRHMVLTGEVSSLSLNVQVTASSKLAAVYSMAVAAKDLLIKPRFSPDIARIKHLRLVTKLTHSSLEASLSLGTGKTSVRESDIVYWGRHFTQLNSSLRRHKAPSHTTPSLLHRIMTVPVTTVTTIEASDWLCSMQLDQSPADQRPHVEVVMARIVLRGRLEERKETDRSASIQVRLDDTYLHIPGRGKSWADNRTLLPSSSLHHWGRALAVGSLALNTDITLSSADQPSVARVTGVCVSGEGRSVILEWSQSTATTVIMALTQLDTRYKVLSRWLPATRQTDKELKEEQTDPYTELLVEPGSQSSADLLIGDTSLRITIVLNGVNAFLYGASPVPVAMLLRMDTISLTTPGLVSAVIYRAAINELTHQFLPHEGFLCQPVASLPSGLLDITDMQLEYSLASKEVNVSVTKGTINWTTPTHIAITHIAEALWTSMRGTKTTPTSSSEEKVGFVKIGDKLVSVMDKVPVVIGVKVEEGVVNMILDQCGSKVAVVVETGHGYLKDGMVLMDSYQLGLVFDNHRIMNLFGFIGNFPSEEGEGEGGRESVTGLQLKKNPTLALCASKAFIKFPSEYNFAATFEKLMCVRKYIQGFHSSRGASSTNQRLVVLPDLLIEVDELLFQLDDNQFEVKLRENHVLMQDEHEERVQRQKALEERLMRTKEEKGRSRVSDKKVQTLYDKLHVQNDSIYCQRARELYNYDTEVPRLQLFTVSFHQLKVLVMADPTMAGRDNLVKHLTDIDSVSPLPSTSYQFSTLMGIYLSGGTEHLEVQLRDYPWKLLEGESIGVSGRLLFAEQEAQQREQYTTSVKVGAPWRDGSVVRKLPPLKYYHDLEINAECIEWCWGPCCEPCFAQINYTFNFITKATLDPSPPLPFWDKFRLLLHGRAHLNTPVMVAKLLASRDPYNEPEYLEVRLTTLDARLHDNVSLDLVGGAHAFVHTASRYDECQLVQLPLAHLTISLEWVCRSAPQCHHEVVRCVPSKLPQLPEGQQHDSYALFRSHNMNITMDLKVEEREDLEDPEIHLYASTLRWLQQYVSLLRETVSRPIRRGRVFKNVRPKKLKLTRHIKTFSLSASFPKTTLQYWSSVYQQRGVECHITSGSCDMKYSLQLIPYDDELVRRPRTDWSVASLQGEVLDIVAYTCTKQEEVDMDSFDDQYIIRNPYAEELKSSHNVIVKHKLVSMSKLTYWQNIPTEETSQEFTHQLKTSNTRILWNSSNKEVVDRLLNAYRLFQRLKKDLSTEALQSIITKLDTPTHKRDSSQVRVAIIHSFMAASQQMSPQQQQQQQGDEETLSTKRGHMRRLSSSGCAMLDSLLADICNTLVVSSVEQKEPSDPRLKGIVTANQDDMRQLNWFIELTNTQLALQGVEKHGYVIASSYVAQVFGREHTPRWREGDLVSKKSWVAKVQDLQFLCTTELSADDRDKVPWLPLSVIQPAGLKETAAQEPDSMQDEESSVSSLLSQLGPEISHPLGVKASFVSSRPPGEAVGGMVACVPEPGTVVEDPGDMPHTPHTPLLSSPHRTGYQLQRIASRGHCQVFYVTYGGDVSATEYPSSDLLNQSGKGSPLGFSESSDVVDTLTFRFPMAEVCTTSSQYHLIVDILNNLLLHKEPRRKEATEQHARMKFLLQLSTVADARKPVLAKQNKIRQIIRKVHELETELYREQKQGGDGLQRRSSLERELSRTKEDLSVFSVELRAMIRAFKEQQLNMTTPRSDSGESLPPEPVRRVEVWLDDSQWNIMQDDGQLQVSEIRLTNFSYNRISFSDDSGEHRFELGSFKVLNCMPNTQTFFQEVLSPYDPQSRRLRVDKNVSMRIYCRDQAPVAGISVTEHLELNIVPLAVRLTEKFYQTMQDFFLPRQEGETRESSNDPDHSHIFGGVQPTFASSPDSTDGAAISRATHSRRSNSSLTFSTHSSSAPPSTIGTTQPSPPDSPISKEFVRSKSRRTSGTVGRIDDVEKMKVRASKVKAFIYVKIPQLTLCLTYKGEGISVKEMHDQLVTVQTLEYHNKKCTWRELLMEVKKDYKNAIISQTIKSAIGIRESEERAGLASPKLLRHTSTSDILLGGIKAGKATSKKLLTRLSSSKEDEEDDTTAAATGRESTPSAVYQPPLADVNTRKRPKLFSKH